MKKTLFVPVLAMAAALSVSCSKEETEGVENGPVNGGEAALFAPQSVISASSAATKTALDGVDINWEEGDAITLFGENGAPVKYTLTGGAGATVGTFEAEGELPAQVQAYAVYPAVAEGVTLSEDKVAVSVAAEQTYNAAGFPAEYPMAAVTSDGQNFLFGNLATVLRLQLKGDATVASVTVKALGENEYIAGNATIDFASGTPALAADEGAVNAVTLDCGEGVALTSEGNGAAFDFVLIPGTYSGLEVTVTTTDEENNQIVKTAQTELVLNPGSILTFSPMSTTPAGWNIVGTFTNNWQSWINLNEFNGLAYFMNVEIPESNSFKIRYNDAWYGLGTSADQINPISVGRRVAIYADSDPNGNGKGNMNVPVGTYDIYYDIEWNSITFRNAGDSPFSVIGLGGDWEHEKQMTFENGYFVYRNAEFTLENASFKIRTTRAEWNDYNIGVESTGDPFNPNTAIPVVKLKGENITLGIEGTYDIWFDFGAKTVWVMTPGQTPADVMAE